MEIEKTPDYYLGEREKAEPIGSELDRIPAERICPHSGLVRPILQQVLEAAQRPLLPYLEPSSGTASGATVPESLFIEPPNFAEMGDARFQSGETLNLDDLFAALYRIRRDRESAREAGDAEPMIERIVAAPAWHQRDVGQPAVQFRELRDHEQYRKLHTSDLPATNKAHSAWLQALEKENPAEIDRRVRAQFEEMKKV